MKKKILPLDTLFKKPGITSLQQNFCFKNSAWYVTIQMSARSTSGHLLQKECPYGKPRTW